ncbi:Protein SUPPRESSOR OF SILENCING 3 [Tripterygium wilfordii]|uniref:Protein SUPPRESSOR OF SILENCING 3 n=1 Tax=Tripterygium wilfordii TaxID=458696 RepID=A0A7J7DZM0_TRIWF|nr:Protein SUPPRESSOR OF SILENCING 3 [Tripterygium wilfordii]
MALSSSSPFKSATADAILFSSSCMDSFEKIVDGVPTGLGRKPAFPDLLGELRGLKLTEGLTISSFGLIYCLLSWSLEVCLLMPVAFVAAPCAASPSDGPVNRCTTSRKATVSVCTKVVKGLQLPASWIVGFSMNIYFIEMCQSSRPRPAKHSW